MVRFELSLDYRLPSRICKGVVVGVSHEVYFTGFLEVRGDWLRINSHTDGPVANIDDDMIIDVFNIVFRECREYWSDLCTSSTSVTTDSSCNTIAFDGTQTQLW